MFLSMGRFKPFEASGSTKCRKAQGNNVLAPYGSPTSAARGAVQGAAGQEEGNAGIPVGMNGMGNNGVRRAKPWEKHYPGRTRKGGICVRHGLKGGQAQPEGPRWSGLAAAPSPLRALRARSAGGAIASRNAFALCWAFSRPGLVTGTETSPSKHRSDGTTGKKVDTNLGFILPASRPFDKSSKSPGRSTASWATVPRDSDVIAGVFLYLIYILINNFRPRSQT